MLDMVDAWPSGLTELDLSIIATYARRSQRAFRAAIFFWSLFFIVGAVSGVLMWSFSQDPSLIAVGVVFILIALVMGVCAVSHSYQSNKWSREQRQCARDLDRGRCAP